MKKKAILMIFSGILLISLTACYKIPNVKYLAPGPEKRTETKVEGVSA